MGHLAFDVKGRARKGTPDAWLPLAAQIAGYARKFAGRGDIVANVGPGVGGPYATACWSPDVADMDVNTETCLPGFIPEKVDFHDKIFQLGALPFVGAVTHEAAHARWTCWTPAALMERRTAGYERWTQATVEVVIALEESRIEYLAVRKDPGKRDALAQCALSIVLKDFKVNNTLFGASISLALTVGRYALLSPDEVDRFRALVAPHLPLGLMPKLEALIREYHELPTPLAATGEPSDAFFASMYSIAERWLIAIRETAAKVEEIQKAARAAREEAEEEAEDEDEPADDDEHTRPETDKAASEDEDESDDAYEGGEESDEHREGPESGDGDPGVGGTDDGAGEGAGSPADEGMGAPAPAESHEDGEPSEEATGEPESDDLDADDGLDADEGEDGSEASEGSDSGDTDADTDEGADEDEDGSGAGQDDDEADTDRDIEGDAGEPEDGDAGEPEDDAEGDTDVREYSDPDLDDDDDDDDDDADESDAGEPERGTGSYDDEAYGESDDELDHEGDGTDDAAEPVEPSRNPREEQPDLRSGIPGEDEEGQTVIVIILTDGDEGVDDAPGEPEGESLADEIREAAGEAAMDREGAALDERAEAETERKIDDRREDRARRDAAKAVAEKRHGEGTHGFTHFCGSHKMVARKPAPGERIAANRLAATLERITFHDRAVTKVDRVVPGGKLRPRAAVAKAADRDRGGRTEIPIWRAKERRHTAETPVTVGILTDVSGSMSYLSEPSAVTTYVVSQAVGTIEGKVATAVFGDHGYLVNRAYERTPMVQPWNAMDGEEAFREGALLIDAELNLLDGDGARVLVIFTDAQFVNDDDAEYAPVFMRLCKQKNVAVVWCSYHETPMSNYGYGAVLNLDGTAADIANTLGAAILKEVSKVEASRGAG